MAWLGLALDVAAEDADQLGDVLLAAGALSVTLADGGDTPILEPAPATTPLWHTVRLEAVLPLDVDVIAVRDALEACLRARGRSMPTLEPRFIEAQDWSDTWRRFAAPVVFGDRLCVAPKATPGMAGRVMLRLDPGLAFGTGSHPTTALCLEWLATAQLDGCSVVDFGCGSGILGIAALLLGATNAVCIDHDRQAHVATIDNAAYNGLTGARLVVGDVDAAPADAVDIVIANILADPLVLLAPRLTALVRHGGSLVLSGIKTAQWPRVLAAYPAFEFRAPQVRDDWIAVEGIRTGG